MGWLKVWGHIVVSASNRLFPFLSHQTTHSQDTPISIFYLKSQGQQHRCFFFTFHANIGPTITKIWSIGCLGEKEHIRNFENKMFPMQCFKIQSGQQHGWRVLLWLDGGYYFIVQKNIFVNLYHSRDFGSKSWIGQQFFPMPVVALSHILQARWGNQLETFSALLDLCVGNSPVTGEFPSQRPVTRSFDVFFDLRLNSRLSKQS